MTRPKYISVHSKKGGVGKTTVALNIANLLLKKGNSVLLFDLDITGTTLVNSLKSVYWEDKVNYLQSGSSNNVVSTYFNKYLNKTENKTNLPISNFEDSFKSNKINIICSQLTDSVNGNANLLFEPNEFFDVIHATWFLDYIEDICNSIQLKNTEKQLYVVFDNSPGYVALSPYLIKWLTDLGPLQGYFLTVSSLDIQDVESCINLLKIINDHYLSKFSTAKYYQKLADISQKNKVEEPSNVDKSFLMQMISMDEISLKNSELQYYIDLPPKSVGYHEYQGLIINRIPEDLFYGIAIKVLDKIDPEINKYIDKFLVSSTKNKVDLFSNIIRQDNYIDLQFKEYLLEYDESTESNRRISSNLKKSNEKLNSISNKLSDFLSQNEILADKDLYGDIIPIILDYQNIFNRTTNVLSKSNVVRSRRFLIKEWHPISTFEESVNKLSSLLSTFSIDIEIDPVLTNRRTQNFSIYSNIKIITEVYNSLISKELINDLDASVKLIVNTILSAIRIQFLFINSRFHDSEFIVSLFLEIVQYQIFEYKKSKKSNETFSFHSFILSQYKDNESHIIIRGNTDFETELTSDYYKSILLCQIKLLSFDNDMKIIYEGLQCLYITNKKDAIHASIREIINNFIVLRETSFIEARTAIIKFYKIGSRMKEFEDVLGKIFKNWGI